MSRKRKLDPIVLATLVGIDRPTSVLEIASQVDAPFNETRRMLRHLSLVGLPLVEHPNGDWSRPLTLFREVLWTNPDPASDPAASPDSSSPAGTTVPTRPTRSSRPYGGTSSSSDSRGGGSPTSSRPSSTLRPSSRPPSSGSFSTLLSGLRLERGLSQNQLAKLARIDPAYVNRMEKPGYGGHPTRPVVLGLAEALDLNDRNRAALLTAAGLSLE